MSFQFQKCLSKKIDESKPVRLVAVKVGKASAFANPLFLPTRLEELPVHHEIKAKAVARFD